MALAVSKDDFVPRSADNIRLKAGFSIAFTNLEGDCLLPPVSVDDLAPGSADGFHRDMGFSPNLSLRSLHSVTLHSAEGPTLLTNLGWTARLAKGGCLSASLAEPATEISLSATGDWRARIRSLCR